MEGCFMFQWGLGLFSRWGGASFLSGEGIGFDGGGSKKISPPPPTMGNPEQDDWKIQPFLLEQSGDWIRWHKNPPLPSYMGGVWEQQICSVRAILGSLLRMH